MIRHFVAQSLGLSVEQVQRLRRPFKAFTVPQDLSPFRTLVSYTEIGPMLDPPIHCDEPSQALRDSVLQALLQDDEAILLLKEPLAFVECNWHTLPPILGGPDLVSLA
jgi:hypothetical protein